VLKFYFEFKFFESHMFCFPTTTLVKEHSRHLDLELMRTLWALDPRIILRSLESARQAIQLNVQATAEPEHFTQLHFALWYQLSLK
jgi:hypothetical protein